MRNISLSPMNDSAYPTLMLAALFVASVSLPAPAWGEPVEESSNTNCVRCHIDGHPPTVDYRSDPDCAECHVVEELQMVGMMDGTPPNIPAADSGVNPAPASDEPITKQEMVNVPGGPFWMGNNGRTFDGPGDVDETPLHEATVDAFSIDRYETTNAMYREFVDATGHRKPKLWKTGTYPPGKANHPVIYVSWRDAATFCAWHGKRLPRETEWEKAARGTDQRIFPWGNDFDTDKANTPQRWLAIGQKADTTPVGAFESGKSPYGVYDMAGGVYEWVQDWYHPYPGNQYPNRHYGEKNKIVRGGSWYDCLSYGCGLSSPTYNRSRFNPDIRNKGFGFRCAKSITVDEQQTSSR